MKFVYVILCMHCKVLSTEYRGEFTFKCPRSLTHVTFYCSYQEISDLIGIFNRELDPGLFYSCSTSILTYSRLFGICTQSHTLASVVTST